jgi:AcrR family transcriptional regulator
VTSTSPHSQLPSGADSRRVEILRIAAEVFARAGYSGTNLRDIAEAAGILTGSLYHHFPSKESLAVELMSAFHHDIDRLVGERRATTDPVADLERFADEVAELAERHRAAVHMTVFDAPSRSGTALSKLVGKQPEALDRSWAVLLENADAAGRLRPDVDLAALREVLGNAIFALASNPKVERLRELAVSITSQLLHGLLAGPPDPATAGLDTSAPFRAAREVVVQWPAPDKGGTRRNSLRAAAREEFSRRGYRATTVRDIAQSAGTQSSVLYRHFESKQKLLAEIMAQYSQHLLAGWTAVLSTPGGPEERLDGLAYLMASAAGRFWHEFVIVRDWWQSLGPAGAQTAPPDNAARLLLLEQLLADGVQSGLFSDRLDPALSAIAVRAVLWVPLAKPGQAVVRRRHRLLRACLFEGAATPGHRG